MEFESKLIPVLREGVDVIRMIFFRKLKEHLSEKYPDREPLYVNRLSGAIINEIFGIANTSEPFASFAEENRACIKKEAEQVAAELEDMRIPLTDALRVQFLCDSQEGIENPFILENAKKLGLLLVDREIPLPNNFMTMVRTLGSKLNILQQFGIS